MMEEKNFFNKKELNEKLTSTLEKVIEFLKLPNFFKEDASLISDALSKSNFDLEQISSKFDSLLDNASVNDRKSVRLVENLFFSGIKIPAVTYYYLEDNKKGILLKNQPYFGHSTTDSSKIPFHLRHNLENNIIIRMMYITKKEGTSENNLILDGQLKKRLEIYLNKIGGQEVRQENQTISKDEVKLKEENAILEEKLSLEREFFKFLKNGKIKYDIFA